MPQWSVHLARALVILVMTGVPIVIAPGLLLEYEVTPKLLVLLCATAALLLCWPVWRAGSALLLKTRHGRIFAGLILLQVVSLSLSTIFSAQPELSLSGSAWHRYGLVTQVTLAVLSFLIASILAVRPEMSRLILTAMVYSGSAIALYAVAQYAGWDPFLARRLYITEYGGELVRAPGTLGHAVYLGTLLAAMVPIAFGLAAEAKGRQKHFLRMAGGFLLVAILLTGSRSAVLAVCAGLVLTFSSGSGVTQQKAIRGALTCALAAVGLLLFLKLDAGTSLRLRLEQWHQDLGGTRVLVWRDSIAMIPRHLLLGFGPETFSNAFRRQQSLELSRAYPEFVHESPHNLLIEATVGQGLPGLLILAGFAYLILSTDRRKDMAPGSWLRASAASTYVSLLFVTVTISGGLLLYVMTAMLVATRAGGRDPVPSAIPGLAKAVASAASALMLVAAAAYFRQDLAYARIAAASPARAVAVMEESYRNAVRSFPAAGSDLWCSRQFASVALDLTGETAARTWAIAAEASEQAERFSDSAADAAYQSAALAIGANNGRKGEEKLRRAIEYAPNWYKPHLLLAQLMRFTGRPAEAQTEEQLALDCAGKMRAEVERLLRTPGGQ